MDIATLNFNFHVCQNSMDKTMPKYVSTYLETFLTIVTFFFLFYSLKAAFITLSLLILNFLMIEWEERSLFPFYSWGPEWFTWLKIHEWKINEWICDRVSQWAGHLHFFWRFSSFTISLVWPVSFVCLLWTKHFAWEDTEISKAKSPTSTNAQGTCRNRRQILIRVPCAIIKDSPKML